MSNWTSNPLHLPAQNDMTIVAIPATISTTAQNFHGDDGGQYGQGREDHRGGAANRQQDAEQEQPPPIRLEMSKLALQLLTSATHLPASAFMTLVLSLCKDM